MADIRHGAIRRGFDYSVGIMQRPIEKWGIDMEQKFAAFFGGYVEAVQFTDGLSEDDELFGYTLSIDNITADERENTDLLRFVSEVEDMFTSEGVPLSDVNYWVLGQDFWLSRNGHGTGFFDGEETWGEYCNLLHRMARSYGEVWTYVGDGGRVYWHH